IAGRGRALQLHCLHHEFTICTTYLVILRAAYRLRSGQKLPFIGGIFVARPGFQIYPQLKKMQAEELITGYSVPWGTKGATKTEYAITEAGLAYLHAWQAEPVTYRPERSEVRLRSAYFE